MVKNVDKGLEARKRSVRLEKGCERGMRGDKRGKMEVGKQRDKGSNRNDDRKMGEAGEEGPTKRGCM